MRSKITTVTVFVLGAMCAAAWFGVGCSSAPETDAERQARWAQGNLTTWETEHGIGPITEDTPVAAVDPAKAEEGKQIFIQKCATCHYLDQKKTGPPLRDVTKRRSDSYVLNQILNPEQMGKLHPDGKKMVAQYAQFMTIQGITNDNAMALLAFLRSERDKPAVPPEEQPGFGTPPPPPTSN
ncbi:MAG: cytochrome c [Candidatus Zixiibacteriota bacterium]